ncbi:flagellar hook capping FlgD N-terminal domain-containing protein [uncultured Oribacterium sp.]|uniref:flagellar hook capping FlgD N-terminal domain-containing protein n=1 Tax=uncultured Oribacterium sp. TaxID=462198 RepID=UPI002804E3B5|nr:flagellar hook capping FlgD N-terminal domain-containing protein [uncultured Oribacterium sp.]
MAEIQGVSSATSPYEKATYSAKSNDKNTLSIESYFKLLSAQLANQDMTSPMDNSEMMAQMTQMAMVQSLGTMTTNMKQEMALTKTSYLAGLIGKDVSAKVPEAEQKANPNAPKEKSGVIASVNLTGDEPSFRLQGDVTDYPLESLLMVRQAGAASESSTTGSAVTAPDASAATTAPGATSSTSGTTAGISAATAGSATPAAAASTAGASTAGTTGSASTASPATGSASTASPATGSASASSTAGTVSTAGTATTATTGTTATANPAGSSVPPAVAASSSASSSEFGPHVAILEREAAAHSASN